MTWVSSSHIESCFKMLMSPAIVLSVHLIYGSFLSTRFSVFTPTRGSFLHLSLVTMVVYLQLAHSYTAHRPACCPPEAPQANV